jgi:predicted RecB family endonuclease
MKKSGKKLEDLVSQIEKILLPHGFEIHKNRREYDDEGVCSNEFDIVVEGKVGSGYYKGLIECRDRPSQGKAPKSWIEQLYGRQLEGKFNKVIAVSTTGFSPGAIELANKFGVEIHMLSEINIDQISDWFQLQKFFLSQPIITLNKCNIFINEETADELRIEFMKLLRSVTYNDQVFQFSSNANKYSLNQLFVQAFNSYHKSTNSPIPEEDHYPINLEVDYPNDDNQFNFDTKIGVIRIRKILFIGELNNKIEEVPLSKIIKYTNISNNEDIVTSVKYNLNINNQQQEVSFIRKNETKEVVITFNTL